MDNSCISMHLSFHRSVGSNLHNELICSVPLTEMLTSPTLGKIHSYNLVLLLAGDYGYWKACKKVKKVKDLVPVIGAYKLTNRTG